MNWELINLERGIDMGHLQPLLDAGYNSWTADRKIAELKKASSKQREEYLDEIESYVRKSDWEEVCAIIRMRPFIMEEAFDRYYEQIPDEMKFGFVTSLYLHNGDSCPNICRALTEIGRYQKPDLPEWMKDQDVITVYRGCDENEEWVEDSISWTTEKDVAEFFANRAAFATGLDGIVYKGKIRVEDILAYEDSSEKEVMQSGKVYDIEEEPFIPGRVTRLDENGHAVKRQRD